MIKEISINELDVVVNFAWNIYIQPTNSSYPRFETKEKMKEKFLKHIKHSDDKLLALYNNDNELIGVVNLFVEKNQNASNQDFKYNNFIKADGIYVENNHDSIYLEFINYCKENYTNFNLFFSYPLSNKKSTSLMEEYNATIIETSIVTRLNKKDFIKFDNNYNIEEITITNFDKYALFHDLAYPNFYWNSQRLKENLSIWNIFVINKDNKVVTSIFTRMDYEDGQAEIFGISDDYAYAKALLSKSIPNIFNQGKESIICFTNEKEKEVLLETGFKIIDDYIYYQLQL